jgi:sortase A
MHRRPDGQRALRVAGVVLNDAGAACMLWVLVVWQWQDPFTALYTTYEQRQLASRYEKRFAAYRPPAIPGQGKAQPSIASEQRQIALAAHRYRQSVRRGDPLGRIKVPRLGLNAVLVAGTDHGSLTKGPGWERSTFLPGEGQLVYIAGHRTTYSAPFAHIDALRPGDLVTIEVPYGTFTYGIRSHKIVPADDLSQLRSHGREIIALQACHPRFFATHRYIAYGVPVRVVPRVGRPFNLKARGEQPVPPVSPPPS